MKAYAIYTQGTDVIVPTTFKAPKDTQLKGTVTERLLEIACRICYDSMGTGRDSQALHYHIQDAPNLSVYAHAHLTLDIPFDSQSRALKACINRKGVFIQENENNCIEVTANLRAILEWDKWTGKLPYWGSGVVAQGEYIRDSFLHAFKELMPMALDRIEEVDRPGYTVVESLNDFQRHISVYLYGSRGFTHEQVRHNGDISQRSTRFVDELPTMPTVEPEFIEPQRCEGEYVWHPLILEYLNDITVSEFMRDYVRNALTKAREMDRLAYKLVVDNLGKYAASKGMDVLSARKQGRGAARGSLGNALASELIFTASVDHWKWIFSQRGGPLADDEIRLVVLDLLESFKSNDIISPYFTDFGIEKKDGKSFIRCPS